MNMLSDISQHVGRTTRTRGRIIWTTKFLYLVSPQAESGKASVNISTTITEYRVKVRKAFDCTHSTTPLTHVFCTKSDQVWTGNQTVTGAFADLMSMLLPSCRDISCPTVKTPSSATLSSLISGSVRWSATAMNTEIAYGVSTTMTMASMRPCRPLLEPLYVKKLLNQDGTRRDASAIDMEHVKMNLLRRSHVVIETRRRPETETEAKRNVFIAPITAGGTCQSQYAIGGGYQGTE